jgi:putative ABC transport system substrate-binding protein
MRIKAADRGGRERRRLLQAVVALLAGPGAAAAGRSRVHRVALLSPVARGPRDEAFVAGLRELGYVEGRNLELAMRFAEGRAERLPTLAAELIAWGPEVLVVGSTIGARAAKQATGTLPIVFAGSSDPVAGGLVSNLAHPGGNITGMSLAFGDGFAGKWLEILKEAAPGLSGVAVLWSSANPAAAGYLDELRAAARSLKLPLQALHAAGPQELDAALASISRAAALGLVVMPSPFAESQRVGLVQFAAARRMPAVYFSASFVEAGGLASYGPSVADSYRRAARHVDKILKGARPGDLPVEQPTHFELALHAGTARALGLVIPPTLLLRADRVID